MAATILGGRDKNWAVIVGSDNSNPHAGVTLFYDRKPADECDGISDAWRHVWRLNIRWPITLRHRRPKSFPGRFQNHNAVQKTMQNFWAKYDASQAARQSRDPQ